MEKRKVEVPTKPGLYLDGNQDSADNLNKAIIQFAESCGMLVTDEDRKVLEDTDSEDWSQILFEVSEDAINWLNDHHTDDSSYWMIDESCLFLVSRANRQFFG